MFSDDELLKRMKLVAWDTTVTPEDLLNILKNDSI